MRQRVNTVNGALQWISKNVELLPKVFKRRDEKSYGWFVTFKKDTVIIQSVQKDYSGTVIIEAGEIIFIETSNNNNRKFKERIVKKIDLYLFKEGKRNEN